MGFNLFFAGSQTRESDDYMLGRKCNRLFTFAEKVGEMYHRYCDNEGSKVFMDSGAFSAARIGKVISIEEYIQFINSTKNCGQVFASLDVIPYPELNSTTAAECCKKSWENYLYIVDNVKDEFKCSILPVYHFGEPIEHLHTILNTEICGKPIDYMGLGGGNAGEFYRNINYYKNVFSIIERSPNPNIKVHAFGMTVPKLLEMFPFYSADSTTWLKLGVNGSIITKNSGTVLISERTAKDKKHVLNLPKAVRDSIEEELSDLGYTVEGLAQDYKKRVIANIKFFKDWADNYKYKGLSGPVPRRLV